MLRNWFQINRELSSRKKTVVTIWSFLIPMLLWCAISYIPALWHPNISIEKPGESFLFEEGQIVSKEDFELEVAKLQESGKELPVGSPSNPVYLPAPHEVGQAFYTSFTTKPKRRGEPWLHESLLHSISIVFQAFLFSSLIGIPLGILAGTFGFFSRLIEPFVEFFRYLPAPAFGALCVAIFGINDAPKVAIIVIGTLFQQILIVSTTIRSVQSSLLEAAQTLGAKTNQLVTRIILPATLPRLYKDQRILLGWAWTYLIVAEVVGASSGITWFINQQAKYRLYDNVFAAIIMIGVIGLLTDVILAFFGKLLFSWEDTSPSPFILKLKAAYRWFFLEKKTFFG